MLRRTLWEPVVNRAISAVVSSWPRTEVEGFLGGSKSKESACNAGDLGSIFGLGRSPGEEHGKPLQYSCLENPQGQRSLASYSPWGCKESDTTERLTHTEVEVALTIIDTTTVDEIARTSFSLLAPLKSQWTQILTLWMGIQN